MLAKARTWCIFTLAALLALVLLCALTVYIVDPFEHYRESSILPLYDQESYNNPGIVRNYDYDAVIIGTSMVEMSRPSVIGECFGVNAVKLPMRGSYTSHMGWQLSHALENQELKLAILAVDAYSLVGLPDDQSEIYAYLWNDNPLDDVRYLLNRDVLFDRVPKMLKNIGKSTDQKRDDMYQWTDVTFSEESVFQSFEFMEQQMMMDADYRIERSTENLQRHIEAYVAAHPETEFYIYMPPYSAAYWYNTTRIGLSEQQFRSRERVCEILLGYDNVKIFDFSSKIEWITDFDEYFDYSHHSTAMSDAIIRAMAAEECRVLTLSDMQAGSERIRQAVTDFIQMYEP